MSRVHVFGLGFVGKSIAAKLGQHSNYEVLEYSKRDLDLVLKQSHSLNILAKDKILFAAAKAPCKTLSDFKYNISILEGFCNLIRKFEFSYLLNVSSDAVYPDSLIPLNETAVVAPNSIHGIMHRTRELYLESTFPGKVGNIRPTLIYGIGDPHNGYGPNQFVRSAISKRNITLFGAGEELRDHIYIEDLATMGEHMIKNSFLGNLNGVTGETYTFVEIANLITEMIPDTKISFIPRSGPIPHNGYRAFENNLSKILGLNFVLTPLRDGLEKMIRAESVL